MSDRCVLAVGAHSGDIEANAGGTLARCAAEGFEVVMAVMTNGMSELVLEDGEWTWRSPEELRAIRRAEAEAGAAVLGARLEWLDFQALRYWDGTQLQYVGYRPREVEPSLPGRAHLLAIKHGHADAAVIAQLIEECAPEMILTPSLSDIHPERRYTANILASHGPAPRWMWEPEPGCAMSVLAYDRLIDTFDFLEIKHAAMREHKSQLTEERLEKIRVREHALGRGVMAGERPKAWDSAAEAFVLLPPPHGRL